MIEVRKCKNEIWPCFECGDSGKNVYWISVKQDEGRAGMRLCDDCLNELIEKIDEVRK